jgi:hypothetical protein
MAKDSGVCCGTCPHGRRISRRDFIKMSAGAGAGVLAACNAAKGAGSPSAAAGTALGGLAADKYIAYCGYDCSTDNAYPTACPGCLADDEKQTRTGTINCKVRACSRKKGNANCGLCGEYPCEKLEDMFADWKRSGWAEEAEAAKAVLDEVHRSPP